jgi:hypothetical protein
VFSSQVSMVLRLLVQWLFKASHIIIIEFQVKYQTPVNVPLNIAVERTFWARSG